MTPGWRPLRWGVVALLLVQVVGLNLWAFQQRGTIADKQASMGQLLKTSFPQVRDPREPALQMQRETDSLRALAGRPGDTDFEPMMLAAAAAWPGDRPPVDNLRYESGKLTLAVPGWSPEQIVQFRSQLQPSGWQVEAGEGRVTVTRANPNSARRAL